MAARIWHLRSYNCGLSAFEPGAARDPGGPRPPAGPASAGWSARGIRPERTPRNYATGCSLVALLVSQASGWEVSSSTTGGRLPETRSARRDLLEHRAQAGADGDPDLAQVLGVAAVLDRLRGSRLNVGDRALDRADDVGDRHLLGGRASQ